MILNNPTQTVLYTIDQAIKEYRKFCQLKISEQIKDITVDQTLALIAIQKHPKLNQKELADLIFKDTASMTRMIDLMVKKDYIQRTINPEDRRRFNLKITLKGTNTIAKLAPTIIQNRKIALNGFTQNEILQLQRSLEKIILNCSNSLL